MKNNVLRILFVTLLLINIVPLAAVIFEAYPTPSSVLTISSFFFGFWKTIIITSKQRQRIINSLRRVFISRTMIIVIVVLSCTNFFINFKDRDGDGMINFAELLAQTSDLNPDWDGDVMKDGFEHAKNSKNSNLLNPKDWDVDRNTITDLCDIIFVHKKRNPDKNNFSETEDIEVICKDVLLNPLIHDRCNNVNNLDELIILDLKCKDIVFEKIPALVGSGLTYYE